MRKNGVDPREVIKLTTGYAREMHRLSLLYDTAPRHQKNRILDRMTALLNRSMKVMAQAHGRRFKPVQLFFCVK